jgi:hypothetical protein
LTRLRAGSGPPPPQIEASCRRWLLQRARLALCSHFTRTPVLPPEALPWAAEQLHGCFVTLYNITGTARGCLGTCEPTMPLYQHIEQLTLSAALTDARYAPVAVGDLQHLVIEIAVLSLQQAIKPAAVQLGPQDVPAAGMHCGGTAGQCLQPAEHPPAGLHRADLCGDHPSHLEAEPQAREEQSPKEPMVLPAGGPPWLQHAAARGPGCSRRARRPRDHGAPYLGPSRRPPPCRCPPTAHRRQLAR